jgi:hypothetical protein
LIIGVAFPVIFLFIAVIWISLATYKHKHQDDLFVNGAPESAKRFEYHELVVATDKFSKQLGKGGFGVVYEGKLMERGHQYQVAVKKLNRLDGEAKDFHAELNIISETRHKNLVKLKGWCTRNRSNVIDFMCWWRQKQGVELFLVFELVPQGNLDMHLHQNRQVLPWERRYVPNCFLWKLIYHEQKMLFTFRNQECQINQPGFLHVTHKNLPKIELLKA